MLVVDAGELAVLVHLMSAGRLQLWDARASLRDRASRILVRLDDGRELRLREFGTQQRAWGKLLGSREVEADEAVATLGPDAYPRRPRAEFERLLDQPRHLHPMLRDQRAIAGIGRSWVDELLWTAGCRRSRRRPRSTPMRASACARPATTCSAGPWSTTSR